MLVDNRIKKGVMLFIAVVLLWVTFIVLKDWLKPNIIKALGGYTNREMKTTIDTLDVKYKDIYVKYKKLETRAVIDKEPEYIPVYRYLPNPITNKLSHTGKLQPTMVEIPNVKRYLTSINDTILQGNIETILSLDSCKIVSQTLKYEPKIPYIREKIVTIVETKETILSQKPKAYIGAGLDINSISQITPQLLYMSKKKWLYKGGYTKSLDNQFPNAVTIGIAKLF